MVVTIPSPDNRWLREYYRWKTLPKDIDKLQGVLRRVKWNLHPLWQLTIMSLQNKKENGDPIVNIFDKPQKQAADYLRFSLGKIVRIVRRFDDYSEEEKRKPERCLEKI